MSPQPMPVLLPTASCPRVRLGEGDVHPRAFPPSFFNEHFGSSLMADLGFYPK